NIRVRNMFQDCRYLKAVPKNFRANNITSTSTDGLLQMFYNTISLESFGDWDLRDMDDSAKQPQSIDCAGYGYACGLDTQQIV